MKKLISSILILAMVLCCFVSCNSNEIEEVSNSSKQVVQVKFDGKAKSMSVGTAYPEAGTLYWAYTAEKQNGGGTTGETEKLTKLADEVGFEKTITFSVGTWDFKLYGFNTSDERDSALNDSSNLTAKCTYYAATTQTLKFSRTITTIPLNAAPFSTTGHLHGMIKLAATSVGGNFVAYKIGSESTWYTTSSAAQSIPSGPNTITLRLYESGKVAGSEEYLNESVLSNVTIYSGLTTTIGGTWDDPTTAAKFEISTDKKTYYSVIFDPNYDGAQATCIIVESGHTVEAPSVSRTGFSITKWTTGKDGTGTEFNSGSIVNSNATYYAQWNEQQQN